MTFEIWCIKSKVVKQKIKPLQLAPRGGKREGAGRPAIGVRRVQLSLDDETIDKGKKIGDGNLSHGVRIAVKEHRTKPKRKK